MILPDRRVFKRWRYARGMGRQSEKRVMPERRLANLDHWAGMWVAVKDGQVIAVASNSRDLVPEVRALGVRGEGAVAQFVPQPSSDILIGVG